MGFSASYVMLDLRAKTKMCYRSSNLQRGFDFEIRKEMSKIYTYWEGIWSLCCLSLDLDWHFLSDVSRGKPSILNVESVAPEVDARH